MYSGDYSLGGSTAAINKTLKQTFLLVSGALGVTAITSYLSLGIHLSLMSAIVLMLVGFGLIFVTIKQRNSVWGIVGLLAFAVIEGLSISPLLNSVLGMRNGSTIVGNAALLTAFATAACSVYAMTSKRDFSRLGGFLFAGLIIMLVASIIGLFFHSPVFHLVISAVSALIFTGYILYDVSNVVNGREDNYIMAALGIFLDIMGLFINLLRILSILNSDD